jgi:choice-of-anchor B domain-containing protein
MRFFLFTVALVLGNYSILAQAPIFKRQNISLLGQWDDLAIPSSGPAINNRYSSCWGYAAKGKEYAIVGASDGVHIVEVTNPTLPVRRAFVEGRRKFNIWREYKVYQNYLYCISDDSAPNSLQIIDLSYLPDSVKVVYDSNELFERGHTIWIEKKNMYIAGGNGTLVLYDLSDPISPKRVRSLSDDFPGIAQAHDMFVRNDTVYASLGYSGLHILHYDSLTTSFKLINKLTQYPASGYNHSSLLMPNGKTLVMLDEVPRSLPAKIINVEDLSDIQIECTFSNGSKATPHNPFLGPNNKVVLAYYEEGIQIYDVSDPKNPLRTGYFDTHYQSGESNTVGDYVGVWSAYTELPSKNLIAVDMQNGLFMLDAKNAYGLSTSTTDKAQPNRVTIFPNPFTDEIRLSTDNNDKVSIRIVDMTGKIVLSFASVEAANFSLATTTLPQGVYCLYIENEDFTQVDKIIKQ